MKNTIVCMCGHEMKQETSTFTHILFQKHITLHDVPHTYCPHCGNSHYDNEDNVVRLLREAYLQHHEVAYYH